MSVYGISKQVIGVDEFPVTQMIQFPVSGHYDEEYHRHDANLKVTTMMMIKFINIVKELPVNFYITEYRSMAAKEIVRLITIEEWNRLIKDTSYVEEEPWVKCPCDSCGV